MSKIHDQSLKQHILKQEQKVKNKHLTSGDTNLNPEGDKLWKVGCWETCLRCLGGGAVNNS
ncbi:MAG: hypothetical protein Q8764_02705 [Pigeon pea little leaf phytoplasma]|uniref:Uncharacterized protein n=1 Tax=Candidatus Phytoplasma fabacearum TaxID=2982628 RepID=A0ABU8ZT29_9MOLU|nr:hypothetical protein ['Bituminaria bituminosa' little leaf phytoplasma]MDO7983769.1 hypothetical protein ['Bituminaria bituminosa' little leaf phytoplasma]MDV3161769.1 hypothetical protein [Pigeon pea little leaf phytoplasma]MDV3196553.1 hypothetical protein [Pigeon pea little leaf phytoplasma]